MKWYVKVLLGLCSLLLLLVLLNVGLNFWIKYQLPKVINRENDSAYFITYKDLTVSLLHRNISARGVVVVPKETLRDSVNKAGIYAKIDEVKVIHFNVWDAVFHDKIKAAAITIEKPRVVWYKKTKKDNVRDAVVTPFEKIISVSDVYLNKGDLKILHAKSNKAILSLQHINLQLEGIVVTEQIMTHKIPFQFSNYKLRCDSLYYQPNAFYQINAKQLIATKNNLKIDQFELLPTFSRQQFVSKLTHEKDLYTLRCKSMNLGKMDWGFRNEDLFVHSGLVKLDEVSANIYRSKEPADDLTKKHLYNKLLRELDFDLRVDTLQLRNSIVEYEEEKSAELGAGKVSFTHFNALATNIRSGFSKKSLPDVKIKVQCRFMDASPMLVDWRFNVMDLSDGFRIKGTLTRFDTEKMSRFTKPYVNATVKGVLDDVHFDFTGNDKKATGNFSVQYDDLKFTIYQKDDRKKKNKFLTFVAKVFVKKDTKERLKDTTVEVDRIPEKSFYNFLWRCVGEGLKKILI